MQAAQAVTCIGQLDFVLELAQQGAGLQATLHFNTDLFDKATAHRMLGHYLVSWLRPSLPNSPSNRTEVTDVKGHQLELPSPRVKNLIPETTLLAVPMSFSVTVIAGLG